MREIVGRNAVYARHSLASICDRFWVFPTPFRYRTSECRAQKQRAPDNTVGSHFSTSYSLNPCDGAGKIPVCAIKVFCKLHIPIGYSMINIPCCQINSNRFPNVFPSWMMYCYIATRRHLLHKIDRLLEARKLIYPKQFYT